MKNGLQFDKEDHTIVEKNGLPAGLIEYNSNTNRYELAIGSLLEVRLNSDDLHEIHNKLRELDVERYRK